MTRLAIVDAGPLYAAADAADADHEASTATLSRPDLRLVVPALVVAEYDDFPLGGTDASVVALAERLDADIVVTLDRRHFAALRPRHREAFALLP